MAALTAIWALLVQGFALVADVCRRAIQWARKPGNGIKAVALVLAAVAGLAMLSTYRANQTIVVVTQERDTALQATATVQGLLDSERAEWSRFREDWAAQQRARMAELEAQREQSAEALAERDAAVKRAEASAAGWQREYQQRGPECRAALETLNVACASLGSGW